MLSLKLKLKAECLRVEIRFSLGPPSAIIETQGRQCQWLRRSRFSLGPPSAIIETLPQTVDLAEYFNNLVCRIFELSCFAQKTL